MTFVVAVFAAVLLILTSPVSSVAATRTWTGGGAPSDFWSSPANWESNVVPVDGDDLVFPAGTGTTTTNDLPNLLVKSLSISSSTTFSGAGIRLQNGITIPGPSLNLAVVLDLPIQVIAAQTWAFGPDASLQTTANGAIELVNARLNVSPMARSSADLSGIISGTGELSGGGELHLRGANTFQGRAGFVGQVYLHHTSALGVGDGTAANGTTVDEGTLFLPDGVFANEAFRVGTSPVTIGRLYVQDGANATITGPVTLGPTPLQPNPYNAILGTLAASGSLRVEGADLRAWQPGVVRAGDACHYEHLLGRHVHRRWDR